MALTDAEVDNSMDLVLYDTNGTSVLASVSIDPLVRGGKASGQFHVTWPAPVELTSGGEYRVVIKPTTTGTVTPSQLVLDSVAHLDATFQPYARMTTRVDAGSWTDDATPVTQMLCGLIIDAVDIPAGSAGGSWAL